jgi:hypothetical protein
VLTGVDCAGPVAQFIGAFTKLLKAIISFAVPICPSVRPPACVEQIGALWMDFLEMRILRKSVRKYSFH